jgi:hypothetical protein
MHGKSNELKYPALIGMCKTAVCTSNVPTSNAVCKTLTNSVSVNNVLQSMVGGAPAVSAGQAKLCNLPAALLVTGFPELQCCMTLAQVPTARRLSSVIQLLHHAARHLLLPVLLTGVLPIPCRLL